MDVCDPVQNSEIEDETDDEWWLVPVKQEQDLDPAANDCTMLSVTHLVCLSFCFLLWPPRVADADIIFLPCGFFCFSSFFISLPNVSRRRLDVYHTSTHGGLAVL